MRTQKFVITPCDGGLTQTRETVGKTTTANGTFKDIEYPFDLGDKVDVPNGNYLIGRLNEGERGGAMFYTNIQIGVEQGEIWYREGWMSHDRAIELLGELHQAGAIDLTENGQDEVAREALEGVENYEALAKMYPQK